MKLSTNAYVYHYLPALFSSASSVNANFIRIFVVGICMDDFDIVCLAFGKTFSRQSGIYFTECLKRW